MWLLLMTMPIDVPATVKARPDFCGAIGRAVEVRSTLNSDRVMRGDTLILTVTIAGVDNPKDVKQPRLDAWQTKAQFETDGATIESDRVSFRYRLRPRGESTGWPRIKVESFHPGAAEGKQVRTHYFEMPRFEITDEPQTSPSEEIPQRFQQRMPVLIIRPMHWLWLVVIPLSLIAIPIASRVRVQWSLWRKMIRQERGRQRLQNAWVAPDPAAAAIAVLQESGVDPSPLMPLGDQIRFAPGSPCLSQFREKAERLLSP